MGWGEPTGPAPVEDYDHGVMAGRIAKAAQTPPGTGMAVGTLRRHVEVDPATMTRILDRLEQVTAERDRLRALLARCVDHIDPNGDHASYLLQREAEQAAAGVSPLPDDVTRQRGYLLEAVQFVSEGECSSPTSREGCDPFSEDGLCEVCTCRAALAAVEQLTAGSSD